MTYKTPEAFLHDLQKGKIPLSAVTMDQYLLAHAWIATDSRGPILKSILMAGGALYDIKIQVQSVKYPEEGKNVVGGLQ